MIKSVFCFMLGVAMLTSAFPLTAQENPDSPVVRAITPEGVQFAGPRTGSADVEWSRVRKLAPGREITLTIKGSHTARLYFVSADDSRLTGLNLTDPTLPAAAIRALREIASQHREYFERVAKGGTFVQDNVRLASAGLFVSDRKVADFHHLVETRPRQDVAAITTRQKGRGVWGHLGPLGGYFVGALAGGTVAGFACRAVAGNDRPGRCDTGAFLTGMLAGGIVGGINGFRAANRETQDVIYRAP
jgi:hypothetical protein